MQQVSVGSHLQGVSLQLCLSFLPPRALDRAGTSHPSCRSKGEIPWISSKPLLLCWVCSRLWCCFLLGQGNTGICMA